MLIKTAENSTQRKTAHTNKVYKKGNKTANFHSGKTIPNPTIEQNNIKKIILVKKAKNPAHAENKFLKNIKIQKEKTD